MSSCIPWDDFARAYYRKLSAKKGRPAKDARLVIGAVIIKHKLCLSDEETVMQIQENPYLQFFVGLPEFQTGQPFAPSLFVEIRRRMGDEEFNEFHQAIVDHVERRKKSTRNPKGKDDSKGGKNVVAKECLAEEQGKKKEHHGKLILDATVAEQAIKYPTDLDLLNTSREVSEQIIDTLFALSGLVKKPRTYRRKARKAYLSIVKQRRPGGKKLRWGIKQQLQYLRRNIGHIEKLLNLLSTPAIPLVHRQLRQYWIIQHVYRQQDQMYRSNTRRCDDRIVSISQPHVRPIVRGKSNKNVEFGAKLSVSLSGEGLAGVDRISWDAFHEGLDLEEQVERYKRRYDHYPEVVIGDPLYGTRENRSYLKSKEIRFSGKPLGRPKIETPANREEFRKEKKRRLEEYRQRIPIEGKFGQGKNGYGLNYIRAKTQKTAEAWLHSIFLVMNLMVLFKSFIVHFYWVNYGRLTAQFTRPANQTGWKTVLPAFGARNLLHSF